MTFRTLLVANRGEIALRVFRTCRNLDIRTVAVFTEADATAPHVRAADMAVEVPSYLDGTAIVAAAVESGAEAVHPGYGFLSERASFAQQVIDAGVAWVGPSPEVIEKMGRKDAAREIAVAAGVPVVPSYLTNSLGSEEKTNPNVRYDDPQSFEYPVLVKAAAGGGGKGMRIVGSADEYDDAVAAARREAMSAFGDDTMLVEKYVERGRHIEVQVIGDGDGSVLHLGTRECSVQRRHQKVIEEAPAPALEDDLRARMHDAAVALSVAVGYTNAGTVEFLLDAATGDFYFLEMNTRLQVEHPVTEIHSGVDLVDLQLRVAAGERLPLHQEEVRFTRHAMEARIYAEDAYGGFLPQAGTATVVSWPHQARVDHALESGQVVSTSFDPMLGKVIVEGADREQARLRLVRALGDTAILGLTTNTGFLRELAAGDDFACPGGIDTAWLDRNELAEPDPTPAREIAAALWLATQADEAGPFARDGFRMGGPPAPVVVEFVDGSATVGSDPGTLRRTTSRVTEHEVELAHRGQRYLFLRPDASFDHGTELADGTVVAPMPGTVLAVDVAEGDVVVAGQRLGVMEAMKMELSLKAPYDGRVDAVSASVGQQVALGATLFEVGES